MLFWKMHVVYEFYVFTLQAALLQGQDDIKKSQL